MAAKVIDATDMRIGTFLILEGNAHIVKKMDVSKTGKHGHAKVRFEAVSAMTGKKKVSVVPGSTRFEVPHVDKRQAQVLSINNNTASLMDSENFENIELPIPEELKETLNEGVTVEYWDMEGEQLIKKVM